MCEMWLEATATKASVRKVARLFTDPEVLGALASHLTARELVTVGDLFKASSETGAYRTFMEGIIHGEEEVRAVADLEVEGAGSVTISYYADFLDAGVEEAPIYARTFHAGGLRAACEELRLRIDVDHVEWAAVTAPGRIVLDSALR